MYVNGLSYNNLSSNRKTIIENLNEEIYVLHENIVTNYIDENGASQNFTFDYKTQLKRRVKDSSWNSDISTIP